MPGIGAEPLYWIQISIERHVATQFDERIREPWEKSEYNRWRDTYHPELSEKDFQGWHHLVRTVRCPQGDILLVEGKVFLEAVTPEEIAEVREIVRSVVPFR